MYVYIHVYVGTYIGGTSAAWQQQQRPVSNAAACSQHRKTVASFAAFMSSCFYALTHTRNTHILSVRILYHHMCMHVCIHILYKYTYVSIYVCVYVCVCVCVCVYINVYTYLHTYICRSPTYTHTRIHKHAQVLTATAELGAVVRCGRRLLRHLLRQRGLYTSIYI